MKINENKFMSKSKEFLVSVLFIVIYFFFQKTIYPIFALLFWLICAMSLAGAIINSLEILNLPEIVINIIGIVISGIALIIVLILVFYLGYLCSKFLKKMNKTVLGGAMIAILIYFVYKIFTETDESTAMFAPTAREVHIFCTASHIFYTIGVFFSDKVKKILNHIKFKRKNK